MEEPKNLTVCKHCNRDETQVKFYPYLKSRCIECKSELSTQQYKKRLDKKKVKEDDIKIEDFNELIKYKFEKIESLQNQICQIQREILKLVHDNVKI